MRYCFQSSNEDGVNTGIWSWINEYQSFDFIERTERNETQCHDDCLDDTQCIGWVMYKDPNSESYQPIVIAVWQEYGHTNIKYTKNGDHVGDRSFDLYYNRCYFAYDNGNNRTLNYLNYTEPPNPYGLGCFIDGMDITEVPI